MCVFIHFLGKCLLHTTAQENCCEITTEILSVLILKKAFCCILPWFYFSACILVKNAVTYISNQTIRHSFYIQSCFVRKKTTDVTVTRGTLWSDNV